MNTNHLTTWEQEEYLLDLRTPQMLRHLAECAECRRAVAQLEQGVGLYREAAVQWSADSLIARPPQWQVVGRQPALRWAIAALIPVLLLLIALLPFRLSNTRPAKPAAQISDDALLDQVDEQLSVAVPSSMESLTHLVSTDSAAAQGTRHLVQTN